MSDQFKNPLFQINQGVFHRSLFTLNDRPQHTHHAKAGYRYLLKLQACNDLKSQRLAFKPRSSALELGFQAIYVATVPKRRLSLASLELIHPFDVGLKHTNPSTNSLALAGFRRISLRLNKHQQLPWRGLLPTQKLSLALAFQLRILGLSAKTIHQPNHPLKVLDWAQSNALILAKLLDAFADSREAALKMPQPVKPKQQQLDHRLAQKPKAMAKKNPLKPSRPAISTDKDHQTKKAKPQQSRHKLGFYNQKIAGQIGFREDKRDTNRKHTIITDNNGNRFKLLNSFDPRSESQISKAIAGLPLALKKAVKGKIKVIVGQGGFGRVRLALDENNHLVVVKKMNADAGRAEIQQFQKLSEKGLNDDRFMQLRGHAIVRGNNGQEKAYLFQELMQGGDLGSRNNPAELTKPARLQDRLKLAHDIVAPVTALHQNGLFHRDLKPENYFRHGQQVKLGDFGLLTNHRLNPGVLAGTPYFLPPEAGARSAQSDKADCFALGKMLYQLSGHHDPCLEFPIALQNGGLAQASNNGELSISQSFLNACEKARLNNKQNQPTLESIGLQLMHPDAAKRMSSKQALTAIQWLQKSLFTQQDAATKHRFSIGQIRQIPTKGYQARCIPAANQPLMMRFNPPIIHAF